MQATAECSCSIGREKVMNNLSTYHCRIAKKCCYWHCNSFWAFSIFVGIV